METTSSVNDITGIELPILEEPGPTGPVYLTTLDELVATHGAIVQRENADKSLLLSVFQPNATTLRTQLIIWASLGFPPNWQVLSAHINPPAICSDGQTREPTAYSLYLLDSPIESFLTALNSQVPGITFSFFTSNVNTIGISVIKA